MGSGLLALKSAISFECIWPASSNSPANSFPSFAYTNLPRLSQSAQTTPGNGI